MALILVVSASAPGDSGHRKAYCQTSIVPDAKPSHRLKASPVAVNGDPSNYRRPGYKHCVGNCSVMLRLVLDLDLLEVMCI